MTEQIATYGDPITHDADGEPVLPASERVAAGAAWLDENAPNWRVQIQLPLTADDLDSPWFCVLGQVASKHPEWTAKDGGLLETAPYWRGVEYATGTTSRWSEEAAGWSRDHGFTWIRTEDGRDYDHSAYRRDRDYVVAAWNALLGQPAAS